MRKTDLDAVLAALMLLLLNYSVCTAENIKVGIHSDSGDCSVCHVASADKLRSWFALGSTKKELKHDLNQICLGCHSVKPTHAGGFIGTGLGHATGNKPEVNHENLPLASDGTITCATTCHDIHTSSEDGRIQRKRLRLPVNSLCISCHDK